MRKGKTVVNVKGRRMRRCGAHLKDKSMITQSFKIKSVDQNIFFQMDYPQKNIFHQYVFFRIGRVTADQHILSQVMFWNFLFKGSIASGKFFNFFYFRDHRNSMLIFHISKFKILSKIKKFV